MKDQIAELRQWAESRALGVWSTQIPNPAAIISLLDLLEDQRTRLEALYDGTESTPALVKIARLEAEVEALRADAERYRWLKAYFINPSAFWKRFYAVNGIRSHDEFDMAIDAAIRAAEGKGDD